MPWRRNELPSTGPALWQTWNLEAADLERKGRRYDFPSPIADVAQLVEHRSCKAKVSGSIPDVGSLLCGGRHCPWRPILHFDPGRARPDGNVRHFLPVPSICPCPPSRPHRRCLFPTISGHFNAAKDLRSQADPMYWSGEAPGSLVGLTRTTTTADRTLSDVTVDRRNPTPPFNYRHTLVRSPLVGRWARHRCPLSTQCSDS